MRGAFVLPVRGPTIRAFQMKRCGAAMPESLMRSPGSSKRAACLLVFLAGCRSGPELPTPVKLVITPPVLTVDQSSSFPTFHDDLYDADGRIVWEESGTATASWSS